MSECESIQSFICKKYSYILFNFLFLYLINLFENEHDWGCGKEQSRREEGWIESQADSVLSGAQCRARYDDSGIMYDLS